MRKTELIDCLYTKDRRKKSKKWLDGFLRMVNIKETPKGIIANLYVYTEERKSVGFCRNTKLGENMSAGGVDVYFDHWELFKRTENLNEPEIISEDEETAESKLSEQIKKQKEAYKERIAYLKGKQTSIAIEEQPVTSIKNEICKNPSITLKKESKNEPLTKSLKTEKEQNRELNDPVNEIGPTVKSQNEINILSKSSMTENKPKERTNEQIFELFQE